ncbi:MAG: trypsin-like serine peptidase [Solirubrobacterales bacterium]
MKRRGIRFAVACGAFYALLSAIVLAAPAPHIAISRSDIRAARRFWTKSRMEKATEAAATESPPPPGESPLAPSEVVPDPTAEGVRENGAVFISERPLGGFGRCSGTAVSAGDESLVFTAGHCVFDEGRWWGRHWVFVPAYRYGERPFGTFVAKWLGTTPGWREEENFNYDVGVAVVSRNERGQTLAAAVGGANFAWGLPPQQEFSVYGYPVARPFNGSTLHVCENTPYLGHDLEAFLMPGPPELGVHCEISGGSSGGGWLIDGNTLDGVTSNTYPDDSTTDYGPYFGRAVAHLYAAAKKVK